MTAESLIEVEAGGSGDVDELEFKRRVRWRARSLTGFAPVEWHCYRQITPGANSMPTLMADPGANGVPGTGLCPTTTICS